MLEATTPLASVPFCNLLSGKVPVIPAALPDMSPLILLPDTDDNDASCTAIDEGNVPESKEESGTLLKLEPLSGGLSVHEGEADPLLISTYPL
jgi:hypothetical protein